MLTSILLTVMQESRKMKQLAFVIWSPHMRQKENVFSVIAPLNFHLAVVQAAEGFVWLLNNKVLI